jgi:hypothetical protein
MSGLFLDVVVLLGMGRKTMSESSATSGPGPVATLFLIFVSPEVFIVTSSINVTSSTNETLRFIEGIGWESKGMTMVVIEPEAAAAFVGMRAKEL